MENQEESKEATDAQTAEAQATVERLFNEADMIVIQNMWLSAAAGFVPVPAVDAAGVTTIQVIMLSKLAEKFEVEFSKESIKSAIAALVGGITPVMLSTFATSSIKAIPVIGQTIGSFTMPIIAAASTYAIGKVFLLHFASGGTLINFDPEQFKTYYQEMFDEGKKLFRRGKEETPKEATPQQEQKAAES